MSSGKDVIATPKGAWPSQRHPVLEWLMLDTRQDRFLDNILVELCERLRESGVSVARSTVHIRTFNPQWLGARLLWRKGLSVAEITTFEYGIEEAQRYQNSPVQEIMNGCDFLRRSLCDGTHGATYPLYVELRDAGYTDYVAWPIKHTLDRKHIISFASDRHGGFTQQEIDLLEDIVPAFALVSEIRVKNRLARTLLETYVGPHASEQILAGATTRGSGVTVRAAIMVCDLRDFATISEHRSRDDVIDLLNRFFDAMCEPVERHGGEILKFMGDGFLAIFPLDRDDACLRLVTAVNEAQLALFKMNAENGVRGIDPLGYGIGIHLGDVMYGNIGSRTRLDFTVIGRAVNIAARLETLTKQLSRSVLMSSDFITAVPSMQVEVLGTYSLKGLESPLDVYAPRTVPA